MNLPRLWTTNQELVDPFRAMRREIENAVRSYDQNSPSPGIGAGAPAINVAETKDAFEVTAELPGVDEKDIKVSLDSNQLVICGEKRRKVRKKKRTGMSRSGATDHSTDQCPCPSSRRTEPSMPISTRAFCISLSRSQLKPSRPRKQYRSRQERCRPRQALRRVRLLLELTVCVDAVGRKLLSAAAETNIGARSVAKCRERAFLWGVLRRSLIKNRLGDLVPHINLGWAHQRLCKISVIS